MKAKASVVAQKLLNLYRQAHVIQGGWAAVNQVFVSEATQDVLSELHDLPTGKNLVTHISNLRDKIEDDSKNPKYIKTVRGLGYKIEYK